MENKFYLFFTKVKDKKPCQEILMSICKMRDNSVKWIQIQKVLTFPFMILRMLGKKK